MLTELKSIGTIFQCKYANNIQIRSISFETQFDVIKHLRKVYILIYKKIYYSHNKNQYLTIKTALFTVYFAEVLVILSFYF